MDNLSDAVQFSRYFLSAAKASTKPEIIADTHLSDALLSAGRPVEWFQREKFRSMQIAGLVPQLDSPTQRMSAYTKATVGLSERTHTPMGKRAAGLTIPSATPRGSTAGLRSGAASYIQPTNTGYDNPKFHARRRSHTYSTLNPVSKGIYAMRPYSQDMVVNSRYNIPANFDTNLANLI